ncbi:MAG TPA: iron ABC transporter permease [Thermotogota bacterium]|nr:iron ABC transporter permease [Thermotogota bacterium]HPR97237.1 iron ABC transporter permease [Thermotogota bacterium]
MQLLKRKSIIFAVLILVPIVIFFVSLGIGRYTIPLDRSCKILFSQIFDIQQTWEDVEKTVIINLRLPRILLALLIGAGLSVSGASFQGMFRNPLVSPHILGVSSGAGFGGVIAMILFKNSSLVFISAFCFGLLSILIAFFFSKTKRKITTLSLVLSGVIVSAFFTSLISLVKFVADPVDELPSIVFWLMGSFSGASYEKVKLIAIPMIGCITILFLLRWRINILSLGEDDVKALGLNPNTLRWLVILPVTVIVSLSVSVSGMIGWVGLAIPHICRMIVGNDHRILIPCSISVGAVYMMLMDDLARSLTAAEIPLGVLTALIGIIIFGFLLKRTRGGGLFES